MRARLDREEQGSTMLLTIFYCVLGLSLVLVVVSATSLYLERKRLFTLADGAALAAAEAWSLDAVRLDGDHLSLELDSADVGAAAGAYLGDAVHGLRDVELVRAASDDGQSATVTMRAVWYAPIHTDRGDGDRAIGVPLMSCTAGFRRARGVRLTGDMTVEISDHFTRILSAPVFAHLGTVRPNGEVQVNPMWFEFDAETQTIRFTHTSKRAKFRNLQADPRMTLEMTDPENPLKYVEVRGALAEVIPDPEGAFYVHLGQRYGNPHEQAPADKADRVILVMRIAKVNGR